MPGPNLKPPKGGIFLGRCSCGRVFYDIESFTLHSLPFIKHRWVEVPDVIIEQEMKDV
jgi:hypothetical protein